MAITVLDRVPDRFLDVSARDLIHVLPSPTLFDLPGRLEAPLFVSVLLHGNEDTGLMAVQHVLRRYQDQILPRRLLLFVGNVTAAAAGLRRLDEQLDFNRVWPGTLYPDSSEAELMREVVDYVAGQGPFASIDIHNNTGLNPHYACLNTLDSAFLHLAQLFSRTVVFFEKPEGVQSAAMARHCPAVTVECGKPGKSSATEHAVEFVEACLALSEFPHHPPAHQDIDLFRTFAVVKVPPETTFSFHGKDADIQFREDIDHINFTELAPGAVLGNCKPDARLNVEWDAAAPFSNILEYADDEIRLAQYAIPSMLTLDPRAVRLDCLCYLMQRINFDGEFVHDKTQKRANAII
ncbi:MAG: M14 family metallopeptidase [Rhodospirillaceae bacterium]